MRTIIHDSAWIAAAIVAMTAGCKFGNPMDRSVKVTQQPTVDNLDAPSPRTRLAAGLVNRETHSPSENPVSRMETNLSPHESTDKNRSNATTSVARKAPNQSIASQTKPNRSTGESSIAKSKPSSPSVPASTDNLPDEYAELLDAFRDSPPEVQQQALRQLIAVSGRGAARTDSPEGIAAALRSSVKNLPSLPETMPSTNTVPTRLASQKNRESTDSEVLTASAAESLDDEVEPSQVKQASGAARSDQLSQPAPSQQQLSKAKNDENDSVLAPVDAIRAASEKDLYAELTRRLESGIAGESDADRYRRQIISRHLMLFAGNPDDAVSAIDGMSSSEQEFLRHYLLGVWAMVDESGHPVAARRWTAAVPEMRLATQQLSASAELLDVRSVAFCKEIQSFGQVTKFDSSRFEAGQKVILYCEVDNFVAEKTADGYETNLQGSYEVFDNNDRKVAGQVLPADKQVCGNHLRDYFIAYQMSLPSGLEPGDYRLELSMECLKGQKYGQASIPLQIIKPAGK